LFTAFYYSSRSSTFTGGLSYFPTVLTADAVPIITPLHIQNARFAGSYEWHGTITLRI